ncbi:MAG: hypothetical protein H7318_01175 [Oligoflexus sp.]|nr:hypothetical protein [Oligoflexus sp.]
MLKGLSEKEVKDQGLNTRDIEIHQRRIQGSLAKNSNSFIKIIDTWRLDNHGILPQQYLASKPENSIEGFVAFVPAAGAASRYFQPLQGLRQALVENHAPAIRSEIRDLKKQGAESWPLPDALTGLIQSKDAKFAAEDIAKALYEIDSPKALLPALKAGPSFLKKKRNEHSRIKGLMAEVYVAPLGYSKKFEDHLELGEAADGNLLFLEQGSDLCTLRFTRDGLPYRDDEEKISLVPAGHGMLVRLFPAIKAKFPKAHSLFIRNIDNVIEEEEACYQDSSLFLGQHQQVLMSLKSIRKLLKSDDLEGASQAADKLQQSFLSRKNHIPLWVSAEGDAIRILWTVLFELFHCPLALAEGLKARLGSKGALQKLYHRPLNALGQVPNNGKDVGGSPVRAVHENGEVSICLELPHASPEDRKNFLENPATATHFNPVFVAAELPEDIEVYDLEQCPFWILAEKNIRGTPVVYHEIVLYEVLGNSYTANVLFPEIPRRLFQPHKTLLDGVKK